jgi:hypothetical protein
MTTPSPELLTKWSEAATLKWLTSDKSRLCAHGSYINGYLRARTEQDTEIAALKLDIASALQALTEANVEIAELMPLAKFGAMVLRTYSYNGDITEAQVNSAAKQTNCMGDAKAWTVFMPNIEATIEQILKEEYKR